MNTDFQNCAGLGCSIVDNTGINNLFSLSFVSLYFIRITKQNDDSLHDVIFFMKTLKKKIVCVLESP